MARASELERFTKLMLDEFGRVHERLDAHDERFDNIESELRGMRAELRGIRNELDDLRETVENMLGYRDRSCPRTHRRDRGALGNR